MKIKTSNGFRYVSVNVRKIWLSKNFAPEAKEIKFPFKGKINRTPKGGLILVPSSHKIQLIVLKRNWSIKINKNTIKIDKRTYILPVGSIITCKINPAQGWEGLQKLGDLSPTPREVTMKVTSEGLEEA